MARMTADEARRLGMEARPKAGQRVVDYLVDATLDVIRKAVVKWPTATCISETAVPTPRMPVTDADRAAAWAELVRLGYWSDDPYGSGMTIHWGVRTSTASRDDGKFSAERCGICSNPHCDNPNGKH